MIWAADDGWRYQPKHVEQFADINKPYIVASCWIIIDTNWWPVCGSVITVDRLYLWLWCFQSLANNLSWLGYNKLKYCQIMWMFEVHCVLWYVKMATVFCVFYHKSSEHMWWCWWYWWAVYQQNTSPSLFQVQFSPVCVTTAKNQICEFDWSHPIVLSEYLLYYNMFPWTQLKFKYNINATCFDLWQSSSGWSKKRLTFHRFYFVHLGSHMPYTV